MLKCVLSIHIKTVGNGCKGKPTLVQKHDAKLHSLQLLDGNTGGFCLLVVLLAHALKLLLMVVAGTLARWLGECFI